MFGSLYVLDKKKLCNCSNFNFFSFDNPFVGLIFLIINWSFVFPRVAFDNVHSFKFFHESRAGECGDGGLLKFRKPSRMGRGRRSK